MMFLSLSFNCCWSLCSGSNTESDNNTLFQLNSLMCDLCLKNCFLLQSEMLWTLQSNIYGNIWQTWRGSALFNIISLSFTLICNYWPTIYAMFTHDFLFFFISICVCTISLLEFLWWFFISYSAAFVKQTWRISRPREEIQWGFVKVKEWSYCVAHPLTQEVRFSGVLVTWWQTFKQSIFIPGMWSLVCMRRLSIAGGFFFSACVVEVSGVSHFYCATFWPVSLISRRVRKDLACNLQRIFLVGTLLSRITKLCADGSPPSSPHITSLHLWA